jgi:hypothetical protein
MPFMKSIATRVAGFAIGMLVVMFILHPDRFGTIWWETYSAPSGGFSLKFPSKPRVSDLQVQSDGGGTAVVKIVVATPNKTTAYIFTYHDDSRFASKTVEEVLNLARDGGIAGVHGALLDEQRIKVDGHQGRDIEARSAAGSLLNTRLIADEQRIVILTVETAGQKVDSNNVQKFFDSLKLSN